MILLLVILFAALAAARYATQRFESAMEQGRRCQAPENKSGAQIAHEFLHANGASDVKILLHNAVVSDYFEPKRRRLYLRRANHDGKDLAAWALALHEAAHALQVDEGAGAIRWRQSCIALGRYLPTGAGAFGLIAMVVKRVPFKIVLMGIVAVVLLSLLLNASSLAVEFNANARLRAWLDERLRRSPKALDKLDALLTPIALRELGDPLNSPRYFFLSALPGTSKSRPD
jgi:uncharacterized protein